MGDLGPTIMGLFIGGAVAVFVVVFLPVCGHLGRGLWRRLWPAKSDEPGPPPPA
jgi:hypothetical protein